MRRSLLKEIVISALVAGVYGCHAPEISTRPPREMREGWQEKSLEYIVNQLPFAMFNPPAANDLITVPKEAAKYVLEGLDRKLPKLINPPIQVSKRFQEELYAVAEEMGYAAGWINAMTPKEAIEFTCDLITRRMNYFGRSQDFRDKEKEREYVKKIRQSFALAYLHPATNEQEREKIEKGKDLLRKWIDMREKMNGIERDISKFGGWITERLRFDTMRTSGLFARKEQIVCRQYAALARDIFFVLKQNNPRLKNTYVTTYEETDDVINHRWNQAITFSRRDNRVLVNVTFFDPTSYDLSGIIEGYTPFHFPKYYLLLSQVQEFTKALNSKENLPIGEVTAQKQ